MCVVRRSTLPQEIEKRKKLSPCWVSLSTPAGPNLGADDWGISFFSCSSCSFRAIASRREQRSYYSIPFAIRAMGVPTV